MASAAASAPATMAAPAKPGGFGPAAQLTTVVWIWVGWMLFNISAYGYLAWVVNAPELLWKDKEKAIAAEQAAYGRAQEALGLGGATQLIKRLAVTGDAALKAKIGDKLKIAQAAADNLAAIGIGSAAGLKDATAKAAAALAAPTGVGVDLQHKLGEALGAVQDEVAGRKQAVDNAIEAYYYRSATAANVLAYVAITLMITTLPAAAFINLWSLARPLRRLREVMVALAEGRTNVSVDHVKCSGSLERIKERITIFRESLVEKQRLEEERAQLEAESAKARQKARNELADKFLSTVRGVAGAVADAAKEMTDATHALVDANDTARRKLSKVAVAADRAVGEVGNVSAAVVELTASIEEINRQTGYWRESSEKAEDATGLVEDSVQRLGESVIRVGDAVSRIGNIATKTTLLGLNASIEAARSGEAGRGFVVVANEVKALAGQTAGATEKIGLLIDAIQNLTNEADSMVSEVHDRIGRINHFAGDIVTAMSDERASANEMAQSVSQAQMGMEDASKMIGGVSLIAEKGADMIAPLVSACDELNQMAADLDREAAALAEEIRRI